MIKTVIGVAVSSEGRGVRGGKQRPGVKKEKARGGGAWLSGVNS